VKTNNHDPTPARRRIATEEPFSISEFARSNAGERAPGPSSFNRVYEGIRRLRS
jgi:hypothetical protein